MAMAGSSSLAASLYVHGPMASMTGDSISQSGPDESSLVCVACEEPTTMNGSQQYGKNPFKRRCNWCCSTYRCRSNLIAKEKKEHGSSSTERWWKSLSGPDQVAYYKKQRRSDEEKNTRRHDVGGLEVTQTQSWNNLRGRKRKNELIPYGIFFQRQRLFGKKQPEIDAEWKSMQLDPEVDRETVVIKGKRELCLEVFAGIEKYSDEQEATTGQIKTSRPLQTQDDLNKAIQRLKDEFEQSQKRLELTGAPILGPEMPDERVQDKTVPAHLLPDVPAANQISPPSMAAPFIAGLNINLLEAAQSTSDMEKEYQLQAKAFVCKAATRQGRAQETVSEKDIINAKAAADRLATQVSQRSHTITDDITKFMVMIKTKNLGGKVPNAMLDEIAQRHNVFEEFEKATIQKIADQKALYLKDMAKHEFQKIKDTLVHIMDKCHNDKQPMKVMRAYVVESKKTVNKLLKEENRKKRGSVAAVVPVETTFKYDDIRAMSTMKIVNEPVLGCDFPEHAMDAKAVMAADDSLDKLVMRMSQSTYVKNQQQYLSQFLEQNGADTIVAVGIGVLAVQRDIHGVMQAMGLAPSFYKPPAAITSIKGSGEKPVNAVFMPSLVYCTDHQWRGVSGYGCGECYVLLSGSMTFAGAPIDDLNGNLLEKFAEFEKLSGNKAEEMLKVKFSMTINDTNSVKGASLLIVPPAYVMGMNFKDALFLRWSYGCHSTEQARQSEQVLAHLFQAYPHLANEIVHASIYGVVRNM